MKKPPKQKSLERRLLHLLKKISQRPSVSIKEILKTLSVEGQSLLLILLSLPFCQPLQIPGLSTPFGCLIFLIGIKITFKKQLWGPKKLLSKTIPSAKLKKIGHQTLRMVRKMKRWTHPHLFQGLLWICHRPWMQKVHGILIALLGLFLALPLPIPFSNLTAAWSILLISFGTLEDDGLFILMGYLLSLITLILFLGILISARFITSLIP